MHVTTPTLTASWSYVAIFTFASYAAILIVGNTDSFFAADGIAHLTRTLEFERFLLSANANRYKFSNPNKKRFAKID